MIDNKVEEIKKHIEAISEILGFEVTDSNANTPLRVAKMYCNELFKTGITTILRNLIHV